MARQTDTKLSATRKILADRDVSLRDRMKLAESLVPLPARFQLDRFLLSIYQLAESIPEFGRVRRNFNQYCKKLGVGNNESPVGQIIEVVGGSRIAPKSRRRYKQALKYASDKHIPPNKLIKFMKDRGGVRGCAERYQRLKRKLKAAVRRPVKSGGSTQPTAGVR
jgi:hypothetical protein